MSTRFRLLSAICAGAALTGGYGLGLYATTSPKAGVETLLPQAAVAQGVPYDSADLIGPAIVRCKGCGPTLADRQMAVDGAGWDGMNDPVVRDHAARNALSQADYADPPPLTQPAPTAMERTPAGESEDGLQPVRIAQAQNSKTPAEEAPADAAVSY